MSEVLKAVSKAGTSIWLDDLSRERMIADGKSRSLGLLVDTECVVGVTTNPAIFAAAISQSSLYADDIRSLAQQGYEAESIIAELTTSDVTQACDLLMPVYQRTAGIDGRVSIEVDPRFARDTHKTIAQARELWQKVDRPNVLIKVPATIEGLPAIKTLISEGISVNVTIIFSVTRYREVLDAFIAGLEERISKSLPVRDIHSVASFFISRVDTEIDARLKALGSASAVQLLGRSAIANAHLAYEHFEEVMSGARWKSIEALGASIQRPLWASTGVKDPAYDETQYVMELIAPLTVNTMPEPTLIAVRDKGAFRGNTISGNYSAARETITSLTEHAINIEEVAEKLEGEGIDKFIKPWLELIAAVEVAAAQ